MSNVKWIKLTTDMFENQKIKYLRSLPDGDRMLLVWVAILTMAGRCNADGFLMLTDTIPYTEDMIAREFNFDLNVVKFALEIFKKLNMVQDDGTALLIPGWSKHQNVEALRRLKTSSVPKVELTEIAEKIGGKKENFSPEIEEIVSYLNETCKTRYTTKTKATREHITARLREGHTVEEFKIVIKYKHMDWGNDGKMAQYLRPVTLFSGKFENYLEQARRNRPDLFRAKRVEEERGETEEEHEITDEEWLKMMEKSDVL